MIDIFIKYSSIFLILFIIGLSYVLLIKLSLYSISKGIKNLAESLTELKGGNLSKQIKYKPPKVLIPFDMTIRKMLTNLHISINEFNDITRKPLQRLCYVGADSYIEGRVAGEKMAELIDNAGDIAIVQIKYNLTSTVIRQKGFENVCKEKYSSVRVINVTDTYGDPKKTYECVKGWIKKYQNLKGIYVVEGLTPPDAAKAVKESGKDIKVLGHDIEVDIYECLKSGSIQASFSQNLYAQGYNPVINLFNHLSTGWKPVKPRQLVDLDTITPSNYSEFWELGKGLCISDEIKDKLSKPLNPSQKRIKIFVSGDERYPIYFQIKQGVLDAHKVLEQYNATADWIVPKEYKVPNAPILSNNKMISFLKKHMSKGYDAIALMINYAELVPYLTELTNKGIPVASFNSEPLGLRGLIEGISVDMSELLGSSRKLDNATSESNDAMQEIAHALMQISNGAISQNKSYKKGIDAVKTLDSSIQNVVEGMKKQTGVIKNSISTGTALNDSIVKMGQQIKNISDIQDKVDLSVNKIHQMNEKSSKMYLIIKSIEDISAQIRILALNASIQAAHSGAQGKGFNVIASEIRNLANLTHNAISDISNLIDEFTDTLDGTSDAIVKSKHVVDKETNKLSIATNQMNKLTEAYIRGIEEVSNVIENTNEITELMRENSQGVINSINETAAISKEYSASSDNIKTTSEHIINQIESIVRLATNLTLMSHTIQGALLQFDMDK